ncbi:cytochrome c [Croceimicrobium hydrocarbonivorans]|uniref:C-type cytochrome n=1 Tax=Croceimicrobium hydrocarbonivorans TaxID=2761580 RepID=A0A7H0VHP6_9FLAO|nr:cytochrome c [Croceimicrobium hydrocarbonivorans]QNR25244.1 c-type cytochrome [Croceimicrobium hydrocarbonivorans]
MRHLKVILSGVLLLALASCGRSNETQNTTSTHDSKSTEAPQTKAKTEAIDPMSSKGIGPISNVVLNDAIDDSMAAEGKAIFEQNCTACHKTDKKYIGPAPKDILERRTPEWIMNMIMNPNEMIQKDPVAKQVLAEANGAIMADQNISEEDARKILEFFRTL